MSIIACSMPRSRQYISNTQGETSQPMKYSSAWAATGSILAEQLLLVIVRETGSRSSSSAERLASGKRAIWL